MKNKNVHITCYLMIMVQCYSALSSLPAPVNLKVNSKNFHHVLTWDPGPGTPPGTQYIVHRRVNRRTFNKTSNSTSLKLKLKDIKKEYNLSVQASFNMSMSPESKGYTFTPFIQTTIGPPMLSVAGCGTCIQVNISMPKLDNNSDDVADFQKLYEYRIYCRKDEQSEEKASKQMTSDTSYRVENLDVGMKYCVKVKPVIRVNTPTLPSEWKCDYTSRLEPSKGPAIVSALTSILLVGGGVLALLFSCLYYTGFLCRVQQLPAVLLQTRALSHEYILTPERIIPDSVSIQSDPEQATNRRPLRPDMELDEENEEEEDEDGALYLQSGRATVGGTAELSSGASSDSDSDSHNTSEPRVHAASISGGCGSLKGVVELAAEGVEPGGHGTNTEGKGERTTTVLHSMPDLDQPGILGHVGKAIEEENEMREEEEQMGGKNSSGNVNLFAVTLGSQEENDINLFSLTLGSQEEDEDEYDEAQSAKDLLRPCEERPLLPTDSRPTASGDTGAQRETLSGDGVLQAALIETYPQDGYIDRHAAGTESTDTHSETEEEEEEEFSGYMGR